MLRNIVLVGASLLLTTNSGWGQAKGKPKTGAKPPAAAAKPAVKLKTQELPDGTGTIGLPAGWVINGAYRGTVFCRGPQNGNVTMGHAFVISRPDHPVNQMGIRTSAPMARDGDLVGALQGVLRGANNKLISLRTRPAPSATPGVPALYCLYEMEAGGKHVTALGYFTSLADDDGTLPYWQLYCSVVMISKDVFVKELPTLMAMWNSWRPNGAKPKEGSVGAMIDATIADSTRRRAQTLKEQQEMYERMNSRFQEVIKQ
ncbi:MAG: hypothetical protein V4671_17785 [Armatimonadota bacterium]